MSSRSSRSHPRKGSTKATGRDYTYDLAYQKKHVADRVARNKNNRDAGTYGNGDGKDIDHKDGNAKNNKKSNLQKISASANRKKKTKGKGAKRGKA